MELVIRATVTFWLLWVLLRTTGKRELSQLTPFELITLMVLGDIVQQGVTGEDMSVTGAVLAASTIVLWTVALSYLGFRSSRWRTVLEARPSLIVRDGQMLGEVMRMERLTDEDVLEAARNQGIADLGTVSYGILEPDGRFSFVTEHPTTQGANDPDVTV